MHSRIRENKRSTAIKFIQKRWKEIQKSSSGISNKRVCTNERYGDTTTTENDNDDTAEVGSIQPTLLFRRPSMELRYTSVHFLNSLTVLGVDPRGKFDIVSVPSWKDNGDMEYDTNRGKGKLLAELKLSETKCTNSDIEVYAYQNGSKIAAGMNSGDMEIISTERISSGQPNGNWCPSIEALWGALPSVSTQFIGPRRRFLRNERFTLPYMLSLTDYGALLEASRDHSTLMELPFWDDYVNFEILRPICTTKPHFAPEKQWAFREGGVGSSTALIAACVDPEMDCFSIRIVDERARETESRPTIFVDTPPNLHLDEHVKSICFSNTHGLVVGYHDKLHQTNALKLYDLRMMWKQPTVSMNLSFPHNDTACIVHSDEFTLVSKEPLYAESYSTRSAILGTLDSNRTNDNYRDHNQNHVDSSFGIIQLTGSDSASDNFAVSLRPPSARGGSENHHVIIDSTRNEIVHQIGAAAKQCTSSTCFSSCLDSMACMWTNDGGYENDGYRPFLSIYDISRSRSELINRHPMDSNKRRSTFDNAKSDACLATFKTKMTDIYGLHSTAINMAMNDYGSTIAMVTDEGDIYIFSQ